MRIKESSDTENELQWIKEQTIFCMLIFIQHMQSLWQFMTTKYTLQKSVYTATQHENIL